MEQNIQTLTNLWNDILLRKKIQVCVEELQGLGLIDVQALKLIYHNPEYKIKQYLEVLAIPNSTFTNLVNRLCKKGYINRIIDKTDLRSYGLSITDFGKLAVEKHLQAEEIKIAECLAKLEPNEQNEFVRLLTKIFS